MSTILGSALPREVHIWLQSLNLTYKINNPKRDLANGWVYAEILSRYYPEEIEMYQYDNGFKLEKKRNNWEHLQKFFKRKGMPVTFADWDPVMHCAPQAAYDLLKKFYTILTGREISHLDTLQPIQEQYLRDAQDPEYAKPTIAKKMKEKELVRIHDEKVQQDMAKTIITAHNELLRTDRMMNPERFTFTRTRYEEEDASMIQSRKRGFGIQTGGKSEMEIANGAPGEPKQVQVKTANKQIRGLRKGKKDNKGFGGGPEDDNDEITLDNVLSEIVGSTLANKMGKNDPEYKNFKESFDHVIQYFADRFNFITDELVYDVFTEIIERSSELVQVVGKNMMDFCDLSEFFVQALRQTNSQITSAGTQEGDTGEEKNIFKLIIESFTTVGNKILNEDPQQTELYFLEYTLDSILEIMCENDFKRSQLAVVLYTFCTNSANAHLRVLRRIKSKIASTNKDAFVAIINDLLEYDEVAGDEYLWGSADMYDFYFDVAKRGLYYQSPVSRTKSLSILSQLAPCSIRPIFELLPSIKKMVSSHTWEIQGQLLILSNCALQELCNDKTKLSSTAEDQAELRLISQTYTEKEAEEKVPEFLSIINQVFTIESPKATQKIGLIYLSSIIKSFTDLCDRYLEILLNVTQEIRGDVLLIPADDDDKAYTKHEYVAGCSAGKYLAYSSYQYWNQTKIIQSLEKHVHGNKMEYLEWPHLEVFKAACRIDTASGKDSHLIEQASEWVRIFKSLKSYLFISLCDKDFSETAIEILSTFTMKFKEVKNQCLEDSLEVMIKTLQLIYQPDIEYECKDNIMRYFESLYFSQEECQKQKDFVYNAIKNYAKNNPKDYQNCNLIELMNAIVQERRGEIFVNDHQTVSRGNASSVGTNVNEPGSRATTTEHGLSSPEALRRTGALRKSIMQSSGLNYAGMNRNGSQA